MRFSHEFNQKKQVVQHTLFDEEDSLDDGSTPIEMTIANPNVMSELDTPLSPGTSKRDQPNFIINSVDNYIADFKNFQEHGEIPASQKIKIKNTRERSNTDLSKSTHN